MTNKEKFLQLVSPEETHTLQQAKDRQQNRAQVRHSQIIALTVLEQMDVLQWNAHYLSDAAGVSLQEVQTLLKGNTVFSAGQLSRLESVLAISLPSVS